jgi:molybdenum cofactor cytidylyltransferase
VTLVALVLAAGAGKRFGGGKLSALFRDEPLVRHAIRAARAAPVERVIVVCPEELDLGDWPGGPPVQALRIASDGLSASLRAGIAAAGEADGAFVFLGDMPLVPHAAAGRLADLIGESYAAIPRHAGQRGHPVLLAHRAFADLARLDGDRGAGSLLAGRDDLAFLDDAGEGCLIDVDRAEDLRRLEDRGDCRE